jgi:coniferyl-aldehyde dehydrogenase
MREEVFGPVLSVLGYDHTHDVIDYLNERPSPLASYWFGANSSEFRRFCRTTSSGGITRNDFALHAALPGAPFGGVGQSGIGSYHGKAGFQTFSHQRAVAQSRLRWSVTALMLPPLAPWITKSMSFGMNWHARRLRQRIQRYARRTRRDDAVGSTASVAGTLRR